VWDLHAFLLVARNIIECLFHEVLLSLSQAAPLNASSPPVLVMDISVGT
jgi:hypothetical protein